MSLKDKVAVIGVCCCKLGENRTQSHEDMLVEAAYDAFGDARIEPSQIQAAWVGIQYASTGMAGISLADPLKLYGIPVTRCENFCASGMDAFRNAVFSVAAGVYDIVLAAGVEKLMDAGSRGLPGTGGGHPFIGGVSAPGMFAMAANRYMDKYGITKETIGKVAVKNHYNGAVNPKAHFQREVDLETVVNAPMIASPLGRFDCCAMTDGAAAAIICRADMANKFRDDPVYVKGLGLSVYTGQPAYDPNFDYLGFSATQRASSEAYKQAGVSNPRKEISFAEVHDCFTITEILNYEDLGVCNKGEGGKFIEEGVSSIEGELPVNPSGGLKSFGHPIGATGVRMIYELTKQLQGRADGRQVKNPELGLAHNLGGPGSVACVAILGL